MKIGYTVGIVVGCMLVALFVVTNFLPMEFSADNEGALCADRDTVFERFNNLESFAGWSGLFGSADPDEREIEGPSGPGASIRMVDSGESVIQLQLLESERPEHISYLLDIRDAQAGNVRVDLASNGELETLARVRIDFEFATLLGRWAILFAPGAVEDLIADELEQLSETLAEQGYTCRGEES